MTIIKMTKELLSIAYRMASIISQQLDDSRDIQPNDIEDFKTGEGYGIT